MSSPLPQLKHCVEVYLIAYEQFGTEPFHFEQIESAAIEDIEHKLVLAVAYGLLGYNDSQFRVHVEPDAPYADWEETCTSRLETIHETVLDEAVDCTNTTGETVLMETETLTRANRTYASVFVTESDTFERVLDRVVHLFSESEVDGIVLRSKGETANLVQRFGDRLCNPESVGDSDVTRSFYKEDTDVTGEHKDSLEFHLFLLTPDSTDDSRQT